MHQQAFFLFFCISFVFVCFLFVELVTFNHWCVNKLLILVLHFEIYWVCVNNFTNIPIYVWNDNPTVLHLDLWDDRASVSLDENWTRTIDTLHHQSPIIVFGDLDHSVKSAIYTSFFNCWNVTLSRKANLGIYIRNVLKSVSMVHAYLLFKYAIYIQQYISIL